MKILCRLGIHRCSPGIAHTQCKRCGARWIREPRPMKGGFGPWQQLDGDGLTHEQAMQIDREISDRKDFNRELRDDYFGPHRGNF